MISYDDEQTTARRWARRFLYEYGAEAYANERRAEEWQVMTARERAEVDFELQKARVKLRKFLFGKSAKGC